MKHVFVYVLLLSVCSGLAAQQDSTLVRSLLPLPVFFTSPETGPAYGLTLFYRESVNDQTRVDVLSGITYTSKDQLSFNGNLEYHPLQSSWSGKLELNLQDWPNTVYGIGPHTSQLDAMDYAERSAELRLQISRSLLSGLDAGLVWRGKKARFTDIEPDGIWPQCSSAFASSAVVGAGAVCTCDGRDNDLYTHAGYYGSAEMVWYTSRLGSDANFTAVTLDARGFLPVTDTHTLAVQLLSRHHNGNVPFWEMATLGDGDMMRGFTTGRLIDKASIGLQSEFRFPIWKRIRGVAFGSVGEVASGWDTLNTGDLRYSWGGGLRVRLNEQQNHIRVDFGCTDDREKATGLYLSLVEAF
jgi:outer membrane protein assembly factor BamA